MPEVVEIVTPLHLATQRDYLGRMTDDKVECMKVAKKYGKEYWDGERRYGYGGYRYIPGRWKPVAESLIARYELNNNSSVLDIGCGKAFLLLEMKKILPGLQVAGFDISAHALEHSLEPIKEHLFIHSAKDPLSYENKSFDLAISLGCFHNFNLMELETAFSEISRVSQNHYVMVESYRNESELFNLQCWALTCDSFLSPEEWLFIASKSDYNGELEFIFFANDTT